jgi:nitrate reductase NapAB chaperone NapD
MFAKPHFRVNPPPFQEVTSVPISGLVVTFASSVEDHAKAIESIDDIPEIDLGQVSGSKLAIVVDSESKRRDQEIWNAVRGLPGVIDLAVAMVAFDVDDDRHHQGSQDE